MQRQSGRRLTYSDPFNATFLESQEVADFDHSNCKLKAVGKCLRRSVGRSIALLWIS